MKKLFFCAIVFIVFSATSFAQCGERATYVTTSCGSTCVSVVIPYTGILSIDISNLNATGGTMLRKPTLRELALVEADYCG